MGAEAEAGAGSRIGTGPSFSVRVDANTQAAAEARRALDRVRGDLAPEVFRDLQIVVSELVANSVRFGFPDSIEVQIAIGSGGSVRGRVKDGSDPRRRLRTARHDAVGGIGLHLVDELATHARVEADGVWFELSELDSLSRRGG